LESEGKKIRERISGVPVLEKGVSVVEGETLVSKAVELYHAPYYRGESTGWDNLDKNFRIEKGQMNILFGVPSHGKSSFMDAMMMKVAMGSKWKMLVFSPENKSPAYHASKLCEIAVGKPLHTYQGGPSRMTEDEYLKAATWISRHFVFLSLKDGGTGLDAVLEKVKEIKPDMVVVDPWNRMEHSRPDGMTETEHIGNCLAKTSALCKALNISFWFVVHPQKLRRDKDGNVIRPGFYEVSGSAHWSNMADNGILVWRDFENNTTEIETVKVRYRHNGNVGISYMKFDRACGRFIPTDNFMPDNDYKMKQAGA
jgi:twinkle protein